MPDIVNGLVYKYFPSLTTQQYAQFDSLGNLYKEWNDKINVISRKDIDFLYLHHVLHSLSIAKVLTFKPTTRIMDVGTGGGFPGIPLAIMFPQVSFYLVDSIGKKIKVVQEIAKALGLQNVKAEQRRAEDVKEKFDFIVSRAVTAFPDFIGIVGDKINSSSFNDLGNGILYLKGGDFEEEIKEYKEHITLYPVSNFFSEDYFETKKIIYWQRGSTRYVYRRISAVTKTNC
ncbi:ribosomal RNA small subunit methyltransferase G [Bacteroidia bacterium]|nr:ribosomal RNA small subunit methyltransferase G [Bacteroidia bacterium]